MSTVVEIPLVPSTPQKFRVMLAGVPYAMRLSWNVAGSVWMLDIADEANVPLLAGVPLVTNTDLLAQYGYLGFGGRMVVQCDYSADGATPSFDDLGVLSHMFFIT